MTPSSVRVLVVDDHPMFRRGLIESIAEDSGLSIVAEVGSGADALPILRSGAVDVLVTDIDMPGMDGLELARRALGENPGLQILILSMHRREPIFNAALDLGVGGYVLKDEAVASIVEAIRRVADGQSYVSPSVAEFVMRRGRRNREIEKEVGGLDSLTPSELRILKLIAENASSKEIADRLGIAYRTVGTHRTNIAAKLGLTGKHPLLNFALVNRSAILSRPD